MIAMQGTGSDTKGKSGSSRVLLASSPVFLLVVYRNTQGNDKDLCKLRRGTTPDMDTPHRAPYNSPQSTANDLITRRSPPPGRPICTPTRSSRSPTVSFTPYPPGSTLPKLSRADVYLIASEIGFFFCDDTSEDLLEPIRTQISG